jgi:hypothetical protein
MLGFTRLTRLRSAVWNWWPSFRFRLHCHHVGPGLVVQGPCSVSSLGTITIGSGVCVRSRKFNSVEISVGRGASLEIGDQVFLN